MVEATTGWLETYPMAHATARNILGLEKQVLWRHGTPERIDHPSSTLCKVLFAMFTEDKKQIPKQGLLFSG
ncbi:hypothetical protein QYF61_012755 [Mycteria americana]|uniref:Uncharacterized protein n=1 Tax=Mycteria americana TaxID=33587 RepID=A0AAN7P536_MYCAM|nr:hypothetical protein QYF61_012755 [Mycteria americana]